MNALLLIVIVLAIYKVCDGFKKGMIKEIISLVSMLILAALAALIAGGVASYNSGKILNVIVAVVLLVLLSVVHNILRLVFFSAKMISKLPVIHSADKLLGVAFGLLELLIFIWVGYMLVAVLNLGAAEQFIMTQTQESPVLCWLYEHNYLAYFVTKYILSKPAAVIFLMQ